MFRTVSAAGVLAKTWRGVGVSVRIFSDPGDRMTRYLARGVDAAARNLRWNVGSPMVKQIITVAIALATTAAAVPAEEGRVLYDEHCASCHGVDLEGQPDWMTRNEDGRLPAPPHDETGHTWHHSDRQLLTIIRDGLAAIAPGYETDMPAFGDELTDSEILSILGYIRAHWPERERRFQEERSRNDPID